MGLIFTFLTAVFLLILALLDVQASGLLSISRTLPLELVTIGCIYALLAHDRTCRATR